MDRPPQAAHHATRCHILQLPVEILDRILQLVACPPPFIITLPIRECFRRVATWRLLFVCRAFYEIALPQLYRKVLLEARTLLPTTHGDYGKFFSAIQQAPALAKQCRQLSSRHSYWWRREEEDMNRFKNELPSIGLLSSLTMLCIEGPFQPDKSEEIWQILLNVLQELPRLEILTIQEGDANGMWNLNWLGRLTEFEVFRKLRDFRLTNLNLTNFPSRIDPWLPEPAVGRGELTALTIADSATFTPIMNDSVEDVQHLHSQLRGFFQWPSRLENISFGYTRSQQYHWWMANEDDPFDPGFYPDMLSLHAKSLKGISIGASPYTYKYRFDEAFPALEYLEVHASILPRMRPGDLLAAPNLGHLVIDFSFLFDAEPEDLEGFEGEPLLPSWLLDPSLDKQVIEIIIVCIINGHLTDSLSLVSLKSLRVGLPSDNALREVWMREGWPVATKFTDMFTNLSSFKEELEDVGVHLEWEEAWEQECLIASFPENEVISDVEPEDGDNVESENSNVESDDADVESEDGNVESEDD